MALALDQVTIKAGTAILLNRVSIIVEPGQFTVILGPNGAGKTTALSALAGDIRPFEGRALLDDLDLRHVGLNELATRRAVVTQHSPIHFPLLVHEVVALGTYQVAVGDREAAVENAMAATDILNLASRDFSTLSGGERQRVHIARALAQLQGTRNDDGPGYLLLDEPTTHLDLKHQITALELARNFADRGGGVLCILHDIGLTRKFADKVYFLKAGSVFAEGKPAVIMNSDQFGSLFDLTPGMIQVFL